VAVLALLAVYILWGSTTPAIKIAVTTLPPFEMAAVRFAIAGALIWTWLRLRGVTLPTGREWLGALITGSLLLVFGNGLFTWCMQFLPATVGALFFSLAPVFMALFGFWLLREPVAPVAAAGLVIGLGGMAYLLAPGGTGHLPLWPVVLAVVCTISWALGSIVQRRLVARNVLQASAMQMLCSAVLLGALGFVSSERLTPAALSPAAIGAVVFLILGGSILGYTSYLWLLHNVAAVIASTYAYVTPIVALAIAVLFLHEPFSLHTAIAAIAIIAGVAMIMAAPPAGGRSNAERAALAERVPSP
jgi:drug/metabolite transporter (DMT)-like permease